MSETADHDRSTAAHPAADLAWPTPDPTRPPEQLTDRELIARAAYCDEIAHTGSTVDQAAALRDLDAAWDEAERRAAGQPAISVPAQVAGYIGLVREGYDHALAAEAATWRHQLDTALPPSELALDDPPTRRVSTDLDLAGSNAAMRGVSGELTVGERADRAQSLAQAAGVDVAGYDPDTDIYTDPATGQVVRLDGRPEQTAAAGDQIAVDWETSSAIAERDGFVTVDPSAPGGVRALTADERQTLAEAARSGPPPRPVRWTVGQHEAYLDSRPDEFSAFNPAADYGDPDWREPASDEEATARTAWLAENTPPAPGWSLSPSTEVDDALDDARERAVHSDWAHDHDPQAWAQYRRLEALAELAPLPQRDALDDPEHDNLEHDEPGASNNEDGQLEAPDDAARLRQRIEDLRTAIGAREASAQGEVDGEQRREQLARWHDDDHRAADATTDAATDPFNDGASDLQQETQDGGDDAPGWTR